MVNLKPPPSTVAAANRRVPNLEKTKKGLSKLQGPVFPSNKSALKNAAGRKINTNRRGIPDKKYMR